MLAESAYSRLTSELTGRRELRNLRRLNELLGRFPRYHARRDCR